MDVINQPQWVQVLAVITKGLINAIPALIILAFYGTGEVN